jgi:hypothetical protein
VAFHFAELNIARLLHPLDAAQNEEFVAVLDAVNAIAEVSPGFVWRLKADDGRSASYVEVFDDPQVIVNLTLWTDPESLRHFTYRSGHGAYFRRRQEWFEPSQQPDMVCWWIAPGELPDVRDAVDRLERLRRDGPSDDGFPFTELRKPPEPKSATPIHSSQQRQHGGADTPCV